MCFFLLYPLLLSPFDIPTFSECVLTQEGSNSVCGGGESNSHPYTDHREGVFPVELKVEWCCELNTYGGYIAL